ncbi:MAG TPA: hypothetical protein VFV87_14415 [Pirellulaceae bacterium]|nr:hypothetical protein [Pirellulaceae bacterium]
MKSQRQPSPYHRFPAHCCYFCGSDEHATRHCDLEFCFRCLNPIDYEYGCTARKCRCGRRQSPTNVKEILDLICFVVAGNTGRLSRHAVARQMKRVGLFYTAKEISEAFTTNKSNRSIRRLLAAAVPKPQQRLPKEFTSWLNPDPIRQRGSNETVEVLDFAQLAALKDQLSRSAFLDQLRTAS